MKKALIIVGLVGVVTMALVVHPAMAKQFTLYGRPLLLFGYANQNVSYSLTDKSRYDTESDFQGALMSLLLEGEYSLSDTLRAYASGGLTMDWIYDIKHHDSSWEDKLFDKSRDNLYVDDEFWQYVKEAHVTWTPGDFYFRVGKQIVKWGETDGFRLMDQINPADSRRGFADVEFETSVIPIWLVRAEYLPMIMTGWLQSPGLEVVFNPNADFIPNQSPQTGNSVGGIWAPGVDIGLGGPYPMDYMHLGTTISTLEEPDTFESEGYEYAVRLKGIVYDTIVTLNYFYGRDDSPLTLSAPVAPIMTVSPWDGRMVIHTFSQGYYPLLRFLGATLTRDLQFARVKFLGGVSPVIRLEGFYAFENTFVNTRNSYDHSDEVRWAIGFDWKVKIAALNPKAFFTISPQFYHQHIVDYPSYGLKGKDENNTTTSLMMKTAYFHAKVVPSFFWMHDVNNKASLFKLSLGYDYTNEWHFLLGAIFLEGEERAKGFDVFENKDYLFFKVSYRWG